MTDDVTKRRVSMRSVVLAGTDTEGKDLYHRHEATDYVRPDFLEAYVEEARKHWQVVEVSEEPDAGPGGFDGPTFIPENLNVENAGVYFPATSGSKTEAALIKSGDPLAVATAGSDEPVLLTELTATLEG